MEDAVYISNAGIEYLEPQKEPEEGKRWSYSYVYYLEDLRNIYRLYEQYRIDSIPALYDRCKELNIKSWSGKEWNQRNLLELVNALKNFKLLSLESNEVSQKGIFVESLPESPLKEEDKAVFREVYKTYFRFREFHQLFTDFKPVIYYIQGGRFTNRFLQITETPYRVIGISDEHADMMRFWDVYLKWGQSLDMLKKYPLKPFDINVDTSVKGLSMAYFYQEMPKNFSVFDYISTEMQGSYHYIPDIVYSVIKNRGYAVEDILERIVAESIGKPDVFRAQSTSAIFINEKENFLFPKIGNTYVTHLLKR